MLPFAFKLICMYISMSTRKHAQVQNEWCLAMCNKIVYAQYLPQWPMLSWQRSPVLFLPCLTGETTGLFDTSSETSVQWGSAYSKTIKEIHIQSCDDMHVKFSWSVWIWTCTYVQDWTEVLFQLVLRIWQGFLTFSYCFKFDRIVCVFTTFYQWGHFMILVIRNLNLIRTQPWTYLREWKQPFGKYYFIAKNQVCNVCVYLLLFMCVPFSSGSVSSALPFKALHQTHRKSQVLLQ